MTTMTRNEAAERLRIQIDSWVENAGARAHANANLSDALATAKAEGAREAWDRISDRAAAMFDAGEITLEDRMSLDAILDEEAAR